MQVSDQEDIPFTLQHDRDIVSKTEKSESVPVPVSLYVLIKLPLASWVLTTYGPSKPMSQKTHFQIWCTHKFGT